MSPGSACMVKFPSKSVWAPLDVPLTITFAPNKGTPLKSTTVPVTVLCSIGLTGSAEENPSDDFLLADFISMICLPRI